MKQFFTNLITRLAKWRNTNMQTRRIHHNLPLWGIRGGLFLLFVLATGNAWAATATYTITTTNKSTGVTTSGTAPTGSSASYSQTYSTAKQMTKGNSATLTLTGYAGCKITGIVLNMKSNKSAGSGTFSAVAGSTTLASISSETTFNKWYDNTVYSTSYKDITVTLTNGNYTIQSGENVVIKIAATVNSLYIESYTITYETSSSSTCITLTTPTVTSSVASTSATLTWEAVSGASSYTVTCGGQTYTGVTATSYTITGLSASTGYTATVTAVGDGTTYCNSTAASVTFTTTAAPSYTVTATPNNTAYGTVEVSGSTITATPADGYRASGYAVISGTADVTQNGNTFTVTPESDCTIRINFEKIPTYTITWMNNGAQYTQTTVAQGSAVTLPDDPSSCSTTYSKFVGWYTAAAGTESAPTTLAGTKVTATTIPTGDATYYAVFSNSTSSAGYEKATSLYDGDVVYLATSATGSGVTGANTNGKDATISTTQSAWMAFTVVGDETEFQLKNSAGNYVALTTSYFQLISDGTLGTTKFSFVDSTSYFIRTIINGTTTTEYCLFLRGSYNRPYKVSNIGTYAQAFIYKEASTANYISSCCSDPAVVTITPASTLISLDANDRATTSVVVSQTGGSNGAWSYSVNPATATFDGTTFTATAVGNYTVTATYTKNCDKSASATIRVQTTPTIVISQVANPVAIAVKCGETADNSSSAKISGYGLKGDITVSVGNITGNGSITVSSTGDSYGTSATFKQTNGKVAETPIYIRVSADAQKGDPISGTLTFSSSGATSQTLTVKATVTCQQYTLTFNANGGSNAPSAQKCYGGSPVTLPSQGSMVAPTNKVFVGWNTDKNATTALTEYNMPTEDVVLYAIWRAADYKISCGDVTLTTQAGNQAAQTVTVTLTDQSEYTASAVSGKNKDMFTASGSGSSLNVTFNPPAGTAEGTYTAQVTLTGVLGGSCTVTLTGIVNSLAVLKWASVSYCYESKANLAINLNDFLYKDGSVITSNTDDFSNNLTLLDETTGTNISFGSTESASATINEGVPTVTVNYDKLTLGHTYRLTFTNAAGLTDATGLQYANATCEFTIKNCNSVTMLPPCPVTTTGFTAKWDNAGCTGTQTLSVYQKEEAEILSAVMPSKGSTSLNLWKTYDNDYTDKWFYFLNKGSLTKDSHGVMLNKSSTDVYVYTPQLGKMNSSVTIDENTELEVTVVAYSSTQIKKLGCFALDGEPTSTTGTTEGYTANFDGKSATSWTSDLLNATETTFSFTLSGVTSTTRLAFHVANYASSKDLYLTSVTIKTLSKSNAKDITVDCSAKEAAVTGLTAGQTYYYTLGNGTEQKVTTRSGEPELAFDLGKLNIQSTDGVCATGVVDVVGENVSACDVNVSLDDTNKMFTLDTSNLTYDVTTGTVGGSVSVEFCPGSERGTKTAKLTITAGSVTNSIDVEGTSCSSFSPSSTDVGSTYAMANLGTTMSGTVSVTDLGKEGENILTNPGFESGITTGWNPSVTWTSKLTVEQSSTQKHSGTYSLKATDKAGTRGEPNGSDGTISCLYSDFKELSGSYSVTFYVYLETEHDATFYFGFVNSSNNIIAYKSKTIASKEAKKWIEISGSFDDISDNVSLFIGRKGTSSFRNFYLDDVVLNKTSAGDSETSNFSGTTATMKNLWPGHNYSYTLRNGSTGCEYGPFMFTTGDSTITPTITIDPSLTINCQTGQTASGVVSVETEWITSDVKVEKVADCDDCSCSYFTLSESTLQSTGGSFNVTFKPTGDVAGSVFNCKYVVEGAGGDGVMRYDTLEVIGVVSAGADPSTPMIEVVDIDTTMLAVDHNIDGVDQVEIVLNREMTEDEIKKNVGCELFFSKYYEASHTVKLWAVYNPTNDTISLKDTYVWVASVDKGVWNVEHSFCPLEYLGKTPGKIAPNEEIIVYASDGTGWTLGCAAKKADMSGWYGLKPQSNAAVSFSGNDALTLVRAETNERYSGYSPKKGEDVEYHYKIDGRDTTLSWRYIDMPYFTKEVVDGVVQQSKIKETTDTLRYQMLDLIGARKASNQPDASKCKHPVFSETEHGDDDGWVSKTGKDMNGKSIDTDNGKYDALSTNRCLLVRSKEVKAGSAAIMTNQGDFYTLGTEWQGAYVPFQTVKEDENQVSCDNFSFVGGFDYASYYSSYTPLTGDYSTFVMDSVDGTWSTNDFEELREYTCKKLLIECVAYTELNGDTIREVKTSTEYKVPYIVNKITTTEDASIFKYDAKVCKECDVVILANKRLSHNDNDKGKHEFRNVKVFPGGNFYVASGQEFTSKSLEMQSKNNVVSYAMVDGSLKTDYLVHEKRIDDKAWYCFSLPYKCKISSIRQLNGKSLGTYKQDWWVQRYDGASRAETGTWNEAGTGYNGKTYWKVMSSNDTLKANEAYLIGIGGINTGIKMKTVYFTPIDSTLSYTENVDESKTVTVYPHTGASVLKGHTNDQGWNFIGHPYVSLFNQKSNSYGLKDDELIMGYWTGTEYTETSKVYVNVPNDDLSDYNQNLVSNLGNLYPFKGYFVQVNGNGDVTLTFQKSARKLSVGNAPSSELHAEVMLQIADTVGNSDIAGILVDEDYTDSYEVARDLAKLGNTTTKRPQLWTYITDGTRQRLAFNALPAASAKRIPLSIYAPKAGDYTLSINQMQSDLSGVTAVTLYYGETAVANLLDGDFTITSNRRATDNGYSITVERVAQITTPINNNLSDAAAPIVVLNNGQVSVEQLPASGNLMVVDAVGRQIWSHALDGSATCSLQHLPAGVYMIVVDGNNQRYLLRTIVK